jgi:hypothetical protein
MGRAGRAAVAAFAVTLLVACGGSSGPADSGGPGSSAAAATLTTNVTVTQTSDQAVTYQLSKGQYKLAWTTTDCPTVDTLITQVGGTIDPVKGAFTFEKKSATKFGSAIVPVLPEGTYTVQQKGAGCTTFKLNFDRIGN